MKKKLFGFLLAATLIVAQATTAFAAGSKELGTTAADATAAIEQSELTQATKDAVKDQIAKAQAGDLSSIPVGPKGDVVSCGVYNATSTNVRLTGISIPKNAVKVGLLHYSIARQTWEYVSANWDGEVLTATLVDLSPIVVVAEVKVDRSYNDDDDDVETTSSGSAAAASTTADGGVATSPKTGVESDWALWIFAAAALAAVSGTALKKSRA